MDFSIANDDILKNGVANVYIKPNMLQIANVLHNIY